MQWKIREAYFNLKWDNGTILNPGTDPESLFFHAKQCWTSSTWYLPIVLPVSLDHTAASIVNIFWQWSADKSKEVHNPFRKWYPLQYLISYLWIFPIVLERSKHGIWRPETRGMLLCINYASNTSLAMDWGWLLTFSWCEINGKGGRNWQNIWFPSSNLNPASM